MQTAEIIKRLQHDYHLKPVGHYLRNGVCPECGKKELFISATDPHHLKCGREDKCGWGSKTRDLYPDLWKPLHELYPPTPTDPNATAKAYLRSRGLDPVLFAGQFQQGQRIEHKAIREPKHTETVRFFITPDKSVTWERYLTVIDMPDKPKKAHFTGSYKGLWWQPVAFEANRGDQVYLVEGILDALSLIQSDFKAVALLSCNNWPEKSLENWLGKGIHWVLGLDNDQAGQRYNLRFHDDLKRLGEHVEVCTAPDRDKRDWNDLLKDCKGKISRNDLDEWFYTGRLLTAPNAKAKALEIVAHTGKHYFTFDYRDQLYAGKYSEKDSDDPIRIENIANCKPEFLYYQKDAFTDESVYYMRATRPDCKQVYQGIFTAKALGSASEFKQRLLNLGPGMMFTGSTKQLEHHQKTQWFPPGLDLPSVQTVNFLGYAKELGGWLFPHQAVFNGQLHQVNADDYFDLPDGRQVKTSFRQDTITLGRVEDAHQPDAWLNDYKTAFGVKGLATLAYWAGSFFAEHLRERQASFPFLELSGEPGTGKTTLLEFLWKLSGRRNYEGIELSKATGPTRWRSLEQLANLPLIMIEGDHDPNGHLRKTFNLEETKPLYNGRGMRGTSPKNQGIETKEPPFRGAFMIAQNAPVEASSAVMERIIRIHWDKTHFSREGREASERLRTLEMEAINGFMTACITQEKLFLDKYQDGYSFALQQLGADAALGNQRIRHNHAQIMGLAHALKASGILKGLTPQDLEGLDAYLKQCCLERHQCLEADSQLVEEFWNTYEYLENETGNQVNHSRDPGRIAISLNHFIKAANEMKQPAFDMTQLRRELKSSKRYPFIEYEAAWSTIAQKTIKCFIFSNKAGQASESYQAKAA